MVKDPDRGRADSVGALDLHRERLVDGSRDCPGRADTPEVFVADAAAPESGD
ncbi:MAG: hypothetical protein H5U40_19030 [Polyangiaceae bacterium]|nr:hypothetical protein [Polyangiaceae bacterium]